MDSLSKKPFRPIADIEKPAKTVTPAMPASLPRKSKSAGKIYNWLLLAGILISASATVVYAVGLFNFKADAARGLSLAAKEILSGKKSIEGFRTDSAEKSFSAADQNLETVQSQANSYGLASLSDLFGSFLPSLQSLSKTFNDFTNFNKMILDITRSLNTIKNSGLGWAFHGGGSQIISALNEIDLDLGQMLALNSSLKNESGQLKDTGNQTASLGKIFDSQYLNISTNLYKAKQAADSLLAILQSPEDQHFLILFQNPSEIRPAGGFLGSYAELTISGGNIKKISADDIYNADRQLTVKVIPPKQLQGITANWGARDANWFFNFPTSAAKTIYFLENSKLYQNPQVRFLGLAAINVQVLKNLLETVGPIDLPDYRLTLTPDNFLSVLQYQIEAGPDKKPGQNPKKILNVLLPLLLEKINGLSQDQKTSVWTKLFEETQNKDILFYFKDLSLEGILKDANLAGEIFPSSGNLNNDYLAVVNANVAGGKSDAFIQETVSLQSEILDNGGIYNRLAVTRTHSGQNQADWWYRAENKDFLKILVPQNSQLENISGNDSKTVQPAVNYSAAGYRPDPDLQNLEQADFLGRFQALAGQEEDKNYFGVWFNVSAGTSKTLTVKYQSGNEALIKDGAGFTFVFEKQSGVNESLDYSVAAPTGYIWKESGQPVFQYRTDNPKAREILNLTLEKL